MRLLLDTNIIIWMLKDESRLTAAARTHLINPDNSCFCSAASIWEISIKTATGKLIMPDGYFSIVASQNISMLDITSAHAYAVRSLPRLHGDPFDRLLIAQAMIEDLTLMTHDRQLAEYAIPCFMV